MTKRDTELQAYKEYQTALQEAEKKKPEGTWYKINAEDSTGNGRLMYDPVEDSFELSLPECTAKIPGKYMNSIQWALYNLMGEK